MLERVNCVLSRLKGNINPRDSQGIKNNLQATKDTEKEADKLDISVSITFMVKTRSAGNKSIFW